MIFVWRGKGFLVPVLVIGMLVATQLVVDALGGADTYTEDPTRWGGVGLALAGAAVYLLGQKLDGAAARSERVLRDEQTGERVALREVHTFFFVPVRYWGLLLLAGGALMLVASVFA